MQLSRLILLAAGVTLCLSTYVLAKSLESDEVVVYDEIEISEDDGSSSTLDPETTPDPEEGDTTTDPEEGESTTSPEEGESTTPPEEGESTTPPEEGESTTSPEGSSTTPPEEGGSSTTPPEEGGSTTSPDEDTTTDKPNPEGDGGGASSVSFSVITMSILSGVAVMFVSVV